MLVLFRISVGEWGCALIKAFHAPRELVLFVNDDMVLRKLISRQSDLEVHGSLERRIRHRFNFDLFIRIHIRIRIRHFRIRHHLRLRRRRHHLRQKYRCNRIEVLLLALYPYMHA